jgi:hypothetical protein
LAQSNVFCKIAPKTKYILAQSCWLWERKQLAKAVSMADAVFMATPFLAGEQKVSRAFWLLAFEPVSLFAFWPSSPPKYFAVSDNILVKFAFANQ